MAKKVNPPIDTLIRFVETNNRDGTALCIILRATRDQNPQDLKTALDLLRGDPKYQEHAKKFGGWKH